MNKTLTLLGIPVLLVATIAVALFYLVVPVPTAPMQSSGKVAAPEVFNPEVGQIGTNGYYLSWSADPTTGNGCNMTISNKSGLIFSDKSKDPCSPTLLVSFIDKFRQTSEDAVKAAKDLFEIIPLK